MARVWVEREALRAGDLPPVCAISGEPADTHLPVRFSHLPPWTYLLLFAGVLPFLIALWFAPEPIPGRLPVRAEVVRSWRRRRRRATVATVAAFVVVVAALALGWPPELMIGALVLFVVTAGALAWVASGMADGTLDASRRWVELRRVHERFAAAVETDERVHGRR